MQSYTVVLSSLQTAGTPGFLNHYLFSDPISGISFTYPATANGSAFITYALTGSNQGPSSWFASYIPQYFDGYYIYDIVDPTFSNGLLLENGGSFLPDVVVRPRCSYALPGSDNKGVFFLNNQGATQFNKQVIAGFASQFNNFSQDSFSILVTVSSGDPNRFTGSTNKRIISKGHWALSPGYVIQVNQSGTVFAGIGSTNAFGDGNGSVYHQTLTAAFNFNSWNHIAMTFDKDAQIFNCYVNGEKQYLRPSLGLPVTYLLNASGYDLDTSTSSTVLSASSLSNLWVGGPEQDFYAPDAGEFFNGLIADVKFFNRAVTIDEINQDRDSVYNSCGGIFFPQYALTANGGIIFPWGYVKTNNEYAISVEKFKGPATIVFCPSAIDSHLYPVLRIEYDFGDGNWTEVARNLYNRTVNIETNYIFVSAQIPGTPSDYNIAHDYWPLSGITTYNPSISVITGDGVYNIYSVSISAVPCSIYDVVDFKLLNKADIKPVNNQRLVVSELTYDKNYVNNTIFAENEVQILPTPTPMPSPVPTFLPTVTFIPAPTPTPTPTPTATPTPTETPTPTPTPTQVPCPSRLNVSGAASTTVNGDYVLSASPDGVTFSVSGFYVKETDINYKLIIASAIPDFLAGTNTTSFIASGGLTTLTEIRSLTASVFYASSAVPVLGYCASTGVYDIPKSGTYAPLLNQQVLLIGTQPGVPTVVAV